MKKFFEELSKSAYLCEELAKDTEASLKYDQYHSTYSSLVGKRALYTSKADKCTRVIRIIGATAKFVVVTYKYYGRGYSGILTTAIMYNSLMCGDDRLEVE